MHSCEFQTDRGHLFQSPCSYRPTGQFLAFSKITSKAACKQCHCKQKPNKKPTGMPLLALSRHLSEQHFTVSDFSRQHQPCPAGRRPCFPSMSCSPKWSPPYFYHQVLFLLPHKLIWQASLSCATTQQAACPHPPGMVTVLVSMSGTDGRLWTVNPWLSLLGITRTFLHPGTPSMPLPAFSCLGN